MCQKPFCGSSASCIPSTSRPLIRPVAGRDQWRWRLDLVVGSFCGKDGTNLGAEGSPRGLIRGSANLTAPCSTLQQFEHSIFYAIMPVDRLHSIVGQEVHCLRQSTYTLTLTCFISLCQPDSQPTGKIKDQQMHCFVHLGTRNLQVNAKWTDSLSDTRDSSSTGHSSGSTTDLPSYHAQFRR
jgi:hypothetical protein